MNTSQYRMSRLARVWSNRELRRIASSLEGAIVNVSAGEDVDKEGGVYADYFPNASTYALTNYAAGSFRGFQARENELLLDLSQPLPQEYEHRFDVVFNHTTLEHVFDVPLAFRSLCSMSRDLVIAVVPFAQIQHDTEGFKDYWRIGPSAIRHLCADNAMTIIYESCNDDDNAAIYIFFVASRDPERWIGKIPSYTPLDAVGGKIGKTMPRPSPATWSVRVREAVRYMVTGRGLLRWDSHICTLYEAMVQEERTGL